MKKTYLILIVLINILVSNFMFSKEILWAEKVIGFSTQYSTKQCSANQILGKPSVMIDHGISYCSWAPRITSPQTEWIRLEFNHPIYISQVALFENANPGAVTKIILYDSTQKGFQVYWNNDNKGIIRNGRILPVKFDKTLFRCKEIKIELNTSEYFENYQIDAVAICDSQDSIGVEINQLNESDFIYDIENLGTNVNSTTPELAPIISQDGKTLYFTRDAHPDNIGDKKYQDVWYSEMDSTGNFQQAINIGSPINNRNVNFAISVSPDGNTIYLGNKYLNDSINLPGFSISNFKGDSWDFPDSISIKNYYNLNSKSSFCFSSNGKVLLFAIQRRETFGGNDLYVSFRNDDGTWTEPTNLGNQINTADDEVSPFLASDGITLYFSTGGYPGFGYNDMFVCKRLDDSWTKWSEPLNLSKKINTPGWDAYYTITASGEYAYFVSNQNLKNKEDIFRIKLPESAKPQTVILVKGRVLNSKTLKPVSAKIKYEVLPGGKEAGIARSNPKTGDYQIVLPAGLKYGFLAEAEGFIAVNENLDLKKSLNYKQISKDLMLIPIEEGQTIRINNIFFEFGKSELLEDSFVELDRLVELMKVNPEMKIQINGHTDNIGTDKNNKELSLQRALSVQKYLAEKMINLFRITVNGFGKSKPIVANFTEEGRQKNRRVEFIIIKK